MSDDSIGFHGIKFPASFDIFITVLGLIGIIFSFSLFWSRLSSKDNVSSIYNIFISFIFIVSLIFFIFGIKSWKIRNDKEIIYQEKIRELDLRKKELENDRLSKRGFLDLLEASSGKKH